MPYPDHIDFRLLDGYTPPQRNQDAAILESLRDRVSALAHEANLLLNSRAMTSRKAREAIESVCSHCDDAAADIAWAMEEP